MNVNVYSVYDKVAELYTTPMFFNNDQAAMRAFKEAISDKQHSMNKSPEDYVMCAIGFWNDETGELEKTKVVPICTSKSFLDKTKLKHPTGVAQTE